jgi:hypothetical protein
VDNEVVDIGGRSVVGVLPPARSRKLAKVPFVELADGRLQGVVSSGSDPARVYVSTVAAKTHALTCATNNNRPCGGLGGYPCKHLQSLMDEAVLQYGIERVARYLRVTVPPEAAKGSDLRSYMEFTRGSAPTSVVFSRFLRYLAYLELPAAADPVPEMHWFPATGAGR